MTIFILILNVILCHSAWVIWTTFMIFFVLLFCIFYEALKAFVHAWRRPTIMLVKVSPLCSVNKQRYRFGTTWWVNYDRIFNSVLRPLMCNKPSSKWPSQTRLIFFLPFSCTASKPPSDYRFTRSKRVLGLFQETPDSCSVDQIWVFQFGRNSSHRWGFEWGSHWSYMKAS